MTKININKFKEVFFFLAGKREVESLESGSRKFGGATKFNNGIFSNFETDNYININKDNNTLSLFIPSTVNADTKINNKEMVKKFYNRIENKYNNTITIFDTKGSWFSEDMNKVIIENITILTLNTNKITENDIKFFINLGLQVKKEMRQEAVSVVVNGALCLV